MDLGITSRKALVCASSKGLGRACAMALAQEGVELTMVARNSEALEAAAQEIREVTAVKVITVPADITSEAGREAALDACPEPDILVNNNGGPPPGDFRDWQREDWIKAVDANMLTAIFLIKAVLDGMIERRFGRIVNLTSSAVKAPISFLGLSNGARAGLTGFLAGIARDSHSVSHNVTMNNILPGIFDTARIGTLLDEETRRLQMERIPAGRFGDPDELGQLCAYLCSAQAAYLTGQNFLIDGGAYPGTF